MKIKILNKNLADKNNYASANLFDIDEGSVFTETYNETLDNATVIISNIEEDKRIQIEEDKRIQIEPYDIVEIFYDNGTRWKYMCVDTYTETMICANPKIYRYQISLFSETKLLESVVLPNLKITKMPNSFKTIYDYINQYMTEYCPEVRVPSGSSYTIVKKYDWSYMNSGELAPHLYTKFNNQCPEMQWNTPTLREVLNDLMMVNDCIAILKDGKLDYIDLTQIKSDITTDEHINYVTRSKSSEDYVSELQVNLENVTNEKLQDKTVNTATKVEYVPFTTDANEIGLNTNNALLKTKYPIYKIKSLKMMFPSHYNYNYEPPLSREINQWMEYDLYTIPGFLTEYQQHITKPILYFYNINEVNLGESQNFSIYYIRGSNTIEGFFQFTKGLLAFGKSCYYGLCYAITYNKLPNHTDYDLGANWAAPPYYKAMFKIEYETLEGCLFRASKGELPDNERVVIDNQTNSYVDSYSQGFLEYQKANRLGNEQLQINARYNTSEDKIKIGDIYDDTVIYQCQYQIYKDHIEVNALATKNYILREYFTGVKSKIRSWKIVSGSEALIRHDLCKYYLEFSWKYHNTDIDNLTNLQFYQDNTYFFTPLTQHDAAPLRYAAINNSSILANKIPEDFNGFDCYYCLDLTNRIVGNSIVLTFGYEDNTFLERSIDTSQIILDYAGTVSWVSTLWNGGEPLKQYMYADSNGELDEAHVYFADGIKVIPPTSSNPDPYYEDPKDGDEIIDDGVDDWRKQFVYYCFLRPRVIKPSLEASVRDPNNQLHSWNYIQLCNSYSFHKDSQEIQKLSTQFEFCSETLDICFTKEWLQRQKIISNYGSNVLLEIGGYNLNQWSNNPEKFDFRRPDKFPENLDRLVSGNITVSFVNNSNGTAYVKLCSPYVFDTEQEAKDWFLTRKNWAWYLYAKSDDNGVTNYEDGQEPILLAFTNIPEENIQTELSGKYRVYVKLYMNVLKSRNKNIYNSDNRYLIASKI